MKAIVFEGAEHLSVKDVPMPSVQEGGTLIRIAYAGICGSDMTIYCGKHPRARAPLVLGHEFSGYIASKNPSLPEGSLVTVYPYMYCGTCEICESGRQNACPSVRLIGIDRDGGMAEYVSVPNDGIFPAPPGISPKLAAFIEPCGISVHAMIRGGYRPGDSVAIFGAGPIGLAVAITLRANGAKDMILIEPNESRLMIAKKLGFKAVAAGPDALGHIRDATGGQGADCIFDCAGHQSAIDVIPDAVKCGGSVVLVAGYKNPPAMDFQKGMMREFTIRFVRNCNRRDFRIAAELVARFAAEYETLLSDTLTIDEAQKGFDLMSSPGKSMKIMFAIS
ncbi:MAG: alcohol dehydrogenase catalytic domain-containing protein [Clostridiales Family XIII bacterium]|jgi:2-desacetyl-2-hydroxyethyl bacteriochlorophyllide A dehydrogenase|nr:alcohol dehydrogenase catalytic domain-containing protein [Clostridiales Family XIII bacterium]